MVGWDEIFQTNLPKDIVIHSWRGPKSLVEAAQKGYQGILSNGYYIDLCQPAEAHYLNDPLPADSPLDDSQKALILGGEATMWAELVTPETIDSRIWPRTAAIAERLWSPASVRNVDDMYRRLGPIRPPSRSSAFSISRTRTCSSRRLAAGPRIKPLKVLAEAVEPLKGYDRHGQTEYMSLSPFTRFVDACAPESMPAREFKTGVDEFLAGRDPLTAEELRTIMRTWRDNHPLVLPFLASSPALREIEQLFRSTWPGPARSGWKRWVTSRRAKASPHPGCRRRAPSWPRRPSGPPTPSSPSSRPSAGWSRPAEFRPNDGAGSRRAPRAAVLSRPVHRRGFPARRRGGALGRRPAAPVGHYLWLNNGYRPTVEARLCWTPRFLYVRFRVEEKRVLVRYTKFQDPVYKDSCVEFFIDAFPELGRGYVNFETNAMGNSARPIRTGSSFPQGVCSARRT